MLGQDREAMELFMKASTQQLAALRRPQAPQQSLANPPAPRGRAQYRKPLPGGYRGTEGNGEFPVEGTPAAGNEGR
jgi:hypothetical protein